MTVPGHSPHLHLPRIRRASSATSFRVRRDDSDTCRPPMPTDSVRPLRRMSSTRSERFRPPTLRPGARHPPLRRARTPRRFGFELPSRTVPPKGPHTGPSLIRSRHPVETPGMDAAHLPDPPDEHLALEARERDPLGSAARAQPMGSSACSRRPQAHECPARARVELLLRRLHARTVKSRSLGSQPVGNLLSIRGVHSCPMLSGCRRRPPSAACWTPPGSHSPEAPSR